jgi:hypothetical protein
MDRAVVELQQVGRMWQLTLNGATLVCAANRDGAINAGAGLLRQRLADPAALAAMQFRALTSSELLPAKPVEQRPGSLPSKIDFAEAKRLVGEKWLPMAARRVGTAVAVVDEQCVEYEWGWVIHWRPVEPDKGNPRFVNEYHFPFTADRVTGNTWLSGGTYGIERAIIELLQQRPPELRGQYPPGIQGWLVVYDAFESAGAFTPVGSQAVADDEDDEPSDAPH